MNPDLVHSLNSLRALSVDMISQANSGHPGICLGAAPIIFSIYANHLKINPVDPKWINRDRFVLSAGHGSALLYSCLFATYNTYEIDDLKKFRKLDGLPMYPEYDLSHRIETTSGLSGQGIANAVGMAISEKHLEETFNSKKNTLFDYKVFCLCSEGDLMEGISYEACSLAGSLQLDNLIILYDANTVLCDGSIDNTFSESVIERFEAMDFEVIEVKNGESIKEINSAIDKAKKSKKPVLIGVNTIVGKYSKYEKTNKIHSGILEEDDLEQIREKLGCEGAFSYDKINMEYLRNYIKQRNKTNYANWYLEYEKYKENHTEEEVEKLDSIIKNEDIILQLDKVIDISKIFKDKTMLDINYQIMNVISAFIPSFMGGSADAVSNTKTYLKKQGDYSKDNYKGKNISFGVREQAMGAILNGMALSNLRVFGSTYLAFSDYLKPSIRMSAMMNLPVTYIFTHDNFTIGEEGPTYQPIEQLGMLRSIPNLEVYRPADYKELIGSWNLILTSGKPSALILPNSHVEPLEHTSIKGVKYGAYIVSEVKNKLDLILISSGEELNLALKLKEELLKSFIEVRVISMPNLNKFITTENNYKEQLFPKGYKKMVLEFSNDTNYFRFVDNEADIIRVNKYLKSASKEQLESSYEYDISSLVIRIKNNL